VAHRALLALTAVIFGITIVAKDGTGPAGPALLLAGVVTFAALIVLERRVPRLTAPQVMTFSALVLIIAVAVPPQASRDLWSYAMYGRAVSHYHESPYTHVAADHPGDPIFPQVHRAWHHTPSVYGPVFTAVSAAGMAAAGNSPLKVRLFFQGLAAAAVLTALALLHRSGAPPGALLLLGLNPVTVIGIVNNGHNDILVGVGVLAAVLLLRARRTRAAGVALALACLVKVVAVVPLGALAIWLWRRDRRAAVEMAGVGGAIAAFGYLMSGGMSALSPLEHASGHISEMSVLDGMEDAARAASATPSLVVWLVVAIAIAVVVLGWQRRNDPTAVAVAAVFAYLLAAPYVLPFYAGWILPTLALTWRSRLSRMAMAHSCAMLVLYSVRAWTTPDLRHWLDTGRGVLPVFEVAVLLALMVAGWRRRQATELVPR
jgi:hypothetical protein